MKKYTKHDFNKAIRKLLKANPDLRLDITDADIWIDSPHVWGANNCHGLVFITEESTGDPDVTASDTWSDAMELLSYGVLDCIDPKCDNCLNI